MTTTNYALLDDQQLGELMIINEDRLSLDAAREIASRASMVEPLSSILRDKQSWLAELPEFWAVVHSSFILGYHGGEEVLEPLLAGLRWADAFDCDWVTESLPPIFGSLGAVAYNWLKQVADDSIAGWSARGVALQGLAAVSLRVPELKNDTFKLIGNIFMHESQDWCLRQMAGNILLDFREISYRMALAKFARENESERVHWHFNGFSSEDVDIAFRRTEPEIWFYQDNWMRFYDPHEIQRRQKRWQKERMTQSRRTSFAAGNGRVISLWKPGDAPYKPEQE